MTTGRINQVARKRRCDTGTKPRTSAPRTCPATRRGVRTMERHRSGRTTRTHATPRRKGLTDSAFCCKPSREARTSEREIHVPRVSTGTRTRAHYKSGSDQTCSRWSQAPGNAHTERAGVRQEAKPPTRVENTARATKPHIGPPSNQATGALGVPRDADTDARETRNTWWRKRGGAAGPGRAAATTRAAQECPISGAPAAAARDARCKRAHWRRCP